MKASHLTAEGGPENRRDRVRTLGLVLAVGAVTWAWSEEGYWARFRQGDGAVDWVATWLLYAGLAYLCLVIVRRFRVGAVHGLFLAGTCLGWIEEGVLTGTTFADLPVSLVWTALAWHAVVTVLAGWWWLPRRLAAGTRPGLLASGLIGLLWGLWAVSWWGPASTFWDTPAIAPDLPRFAVFTVSIAAVSAAGYALWHRLPARPWELRGRVPPLVLMVAALAWFGAVVVPRVPFAPLLLASLLGAAVWGRRRQARHATAAGPLEDTRWGVPPRRLAPLAAIPLVATAVYTAWLPASGTSVPRVLHGAIPLTLTATALVMFARSMRRAAGPPRAGGSAGGGADDQVGVQDDR